MLSTKLRITKSRFLAGMHCPLRLWYQCHSPELAPAVSSSDQFRMDAGIEVGKLACRLYPDGERIELGRADISGAVSQTHSLVEDDSTTAIFEATFEHDDLLIRSDILKRADLGRWSLLEVKSSTGLKEEHIYDVWFQCHVLTELGIKLNDTGILHIRKDYTFDGQEVDLDQFFEFHDLKTEVAGLDSELRHGLIKLRRVVGQEHPPSIEMTKHCAGCEFFDHCSRDKPKFWIYYLPRISKKKWNQLTELDVEDISSIPQDFDLTTAQKVVRNSTTSGEEHIGPGFLEALQQVTYPLHFLDFESFSEPIPRFARVMPWQQITFQWSCHGLDEEGNLSHTEFLHDQNTDPRSEFIDSMLACLGVKGTIIHYAPFEKTRIRELAVAFPEWEVPLKAIELRLHDLCQVMRSHYYHPDFTGSYSIKQVLPVLVPKLSYSELDIQEGGTASIEYLRMINANTRENEIADIQRSLLAYCKLDTLAMVRIREALMEKTSL